MKRLESLLILPIRASTLASRLLAVLFVTHFMGLAEMGQYALLSATTTVMPSIMGLGLMAYLSREAVTQEPDEVTRNLLALWSWSTLGYVAALAVAAPVLSHFNLLAIGIWACALSYLEQLNADAMSVLVNRKKAVAANVILFIRWAAWIYVYMIWAFFVPALRTLDSLLVFWLAGQVLGLVAFAFVSRDWPWRMGMAALQIPWLRETFMKARHFWLFNICDAIAGNVDKFVITSFLGLELTGVYSLYWQMANALRTLTHSSIYQPRRPLMIEAFSDNDMPLHRSRTLGTSRDMALASLGLSLAVIAVAYFGLPLMGKPELVEHMPILVAVIGAMLVRIVSDTFAYGLFTSRRDAAFVGSTLLELFLSIACNIALVPMMGIAGSAVSSVIVGFGIGIWRLAALKKLWSPPQQGLTHAC